MGFIFEYLQCYKCDFGHTMSHSVHLSNDIHLTGLNFVSSYLSAVYSSIPDGFNCRRDILHGAAY